MEWFMIAIVVAAVAYVIRLAVVARANEQASKAGSNKQSSNASRGEFFVDSALLAWKLRDDDPNAVAIVRCKRAKKSNALVDLTLPDKINGKAVVEIAAKAFEGCSFLSSLTLPEGLEKIGEGAFLGCSSLSSLTLPTSLKETGEDAFESDCVFTVVAGSYAARWARENGRLFKTREKR